MEQTVVGILLFDQAEVLDFSGPFEVFSRTRLEAGIDARRSEDTAPFSVLTISDDGQPITATGGLVVTPTYSFATAPPVDILLIPGGFGTRALITNEPVLRWVRNAASTARLVTSVCTGSLVLAAAGLLKGRRATTHWGALDQLGEIDPSIQVQRDLRVVSDGIISSAGVAAGIDMAFTVVALLHGVEVATETARYIEYPWTPPSDRSKTVAAS